MRKAILYLLVINIFVLLSNRLFAQTVQRGRESARGEVNFTDLANYQLAHPPAFFEKELENDEDEPHPVRPAVDPTLIRYRPTPPTFGPYTPTPLSPPLPVSPSPTDTFESTLDNGTAFPPDTHGAVDSNYCVTAINTVVHIQTRAGANVSSVSLDAFWNSVLPGGGTFDPRVHYDPYHHRWIMVADANGQLSSSSLLIGVSKTSNPTGGWWLYIVPIAAPGYWLDYPNVGYNQKWVVVTGNLFGLPSGYGGCKTYAFDYASLMSGAGAPFTAFTHASSGSIAPVLTYDATLQNIFAIESWNGNAGGGGEMQLWKISGAVGSETMTSVGFPSSTGFNWAQTNTPSGDFAPQLGTANKIQNNDDRVFSSVYMNNNIWCSHNVFLPATGTTTRCSAQWWQIDTFGTPIQIGLIDDPTNTNFYSFPSIAVNTSNDAIIGFTQFAASTHPNCAYAIRMHTDAIDSTRPWVVYRHGQNTYYKSGGGRDRWGDYSASCIDPLNMTDFWTIQETSASTVNTWDTWWAYINMCNITATITPSGPTTFCSGSSVTLTATAGLGYSYQWQLGGTPIAGATNSTYLASVGGSYTVVITSGCSATSTATVVTVNPPPAAITGTLAACVGSTTTLSDITGGGTFSSGAPGVATVGPTTGIVNGISVGTATISYTITLTGCYTTVVVTVNTVPSAISGSLNVCQGSTTALGDLVGGGTWSSGNPGVATINPVTGLVTGVAPGNSLITYSLGAGCSVTATVTVNPLPAAITGTTTLCVGASAPLGDATPGGTWSSSNTSVATVSGLGVVTGVGTGGTATIAYTLGTGCAASVVVTVNSASPAAISGLLSVCTGQTITLSDATPGGTWSSSAPAVAAVSSSGVVTGMSVGTAHITYTVSNACGTGFAVTTITVTNPSSITPSVSITVSSNPVCTGQSVTFTAVPVNGGSSPSYTWVKNGVNVASGPTFTYAPANGDIVMCKMTSNYPCISTPLAVSAPITMSVQTHLTNTVTIFVSQSTIVSGSVDTFVAVAPNGGPTPLYQWLLNGAPIPGATNSIYITNTLSAGQVISCSVTSSLTCAAPGTVISTGITVTVIPVGVEQVTKNSGNFTIMPNPNKGEFIVQGRLGSVSDEKVSVVITDMLGQVIYTQSAVAHNGSLNENIILGPSVANGVYLVCVASANERAVYHVVVNR